MNPGQANELATLRARLDAIDARLVETLAERARMVREIWDWKRRNGVERTDPAREAEVRERLLASAAAQGLDREAVDEVLRAVIGRSLSRR